MEEIKNTPKQSNVKSIDLFDSKLPDLSTAKTASVEMNSEYWTPVTIGEAKRLFFYKVQLEKMIDQLSGEEIMMNVIYFVEQTEDGCKKLIRQCSRLLVAVFEPFIEAGTIKAGDAFQITYKGKKKNKVNSFSCDYWSVLQLILE